MFTLHNLTKTTTKKRKRLGRGEGSRVGKNCGKGHKGQLKRSGPKKITFEGGQKPLVRRLPKFAQTESFDKLNRPVFSLSILDHFFENGDTLDLATFQAKGLVDKNISQIRIIKSGELTKKLKLSEDEKVYLTKGAKDAITA
jgi:large subunit ribosomal protein L15